MEHFGKDTLETKIDIVNTQIMDPKLLQQLHLIYTIKTSNASKDYDFIIIYSRFFERTKIYFVSLKIENTVEPIQTPTSGISRVSMHLCLKRTYFWGVINCILTLTGSFLMASLCRSTGQQQNGD